MAPSLKKTFLGVLSAISFIVLTSILYFMPPEVGAAAPLFINLARVVILSYNIAVFFAFFALGTIFGSGLALLSFIFVLLFNIKLDIAGNTILAMSFFLTAYFSFLYHRAGRALNDAHHLKLEKTGEDIILLSNDINEKLKNISLVEEKLKRYAALKDVIDSFSTRLFPDDIKALIIEKASKVLAKRGRILLFLVDTEKQELMLSASDGAGHAAAKKGDVFDRWVLKNRRSLIVEDIVTDFRFSADSHGDLKKIFRSLIEVPLSSGDKMIGALRMDSAREFTYSQDDLRLLGIIADLGAISIENAVLYSRTQELAIKDSLTGLAVRRYFMERLQEELKRAAIKKANLALLMLDIDHFKEYNDRFGHAAGDIILKHFAQVMSSMVRGGDMVSRYGGEEIVIMLCGRSKQEAAIEAEKIRESIKQSPVVFRRHEADVTVSIGVSSYPEDALNTEGLIKAADSRLYKAKGEGRDRVCQA